MERESDYQNVPRLIHTATGEVTPYQPDGHQDDQRTNSA